MTTALVLAAIIGIGPVQGDNTARVVEAVSRLGNGDTLRFAKGEYHFHEKNGKAVFTGNRLPERFRESPYAFGNDVSSEDRRKFPGP